MLNQTGQVDRHTLPSSLPFPSRTSVPGSRTFACPFLRLPQFITVQYRLLFRSFCSLQEEWLDVEDSEWFDPYCAEFPPEVTPVARDPIFG